MSISEAREWTAKSGHKITGEFVKLDGQNVHLVLPDNKTAEVLLDRLIDKDQEFIKEQAEKNKNPFVIKDKPTISQPNKPVTSIKIDRNTSFDVLKAEAEKNNPDALCWLSIYYAGGLNVCRIDKAKVLELHQKAAKFAESGSATAQFSQGICYFNGYGVTLNHGLAVNWFRKSADQNFAPALERLAMCLLLGDGVKENKTKAIRLLQKAADQDFALAMFDIGICNGMGNGVPENQDEAIKWYRKAADKGLATAQLTMGHCYYKGISVKEDKTEALTWYKKAALQGDKEANKIIKQIEQIEKDIP
ncbi:MAG: sel1 repeat family protein [Planctomycetaceae bacterium]|nr:sel1 repeat family protein [Planctomycetaceae bacterium]